MSEAILQTPQWDMLLLNLKFCTSAQASSRIFLLLFSSTNKEPRKGQGGGESMSVGAITFS
jgi:hypothetical protein